MGSTEGDQPIQAILPRRQGDTMVIRLHRKEFIQPFEKELALQEMEGLGLKVKSRDESSSLFHIHVDSTEEVKSKLDRLTYFDWTADGFFRPTLQSCREGTVRTAIPRHPSFPKSRILRFGPHDLHEYRGKFFPQLVRSLLNKEGLKTESVVLDPMCGSGTTLVESRALDMHSLGIDRNPLSVLVTDAKTSAIGWSIPKVDRIRRQVQEILRLEQKDVSFPWEGKDQDYLLRWFADGTLREIASLLEGIHKAKDKDCRKLFLVCLSDIVRRVSYQKMDDLRVRKEYRRYRKGESIELFKEKVHASLSSIAKLVTVDSSHDMSYDVKMGDAQSPELHYSQQVGEVDAIVTSPPYATALPYLDTDRLSLIILGLLPRSRHGSVEAEMIGSREITEKRRKVLWDSYLAKRDELPQSVTDLIDRLAELYHGDGVGFRRRNLPALLARYFLGMKKVLGGMERMLRPGAPAFVVVGNNSTRAGGRRMEIKTDSLIMEIAEAIGFDVKPRTDMELLVSRDIFKNNRGTRESILHLVKPQ